MLTQHTSAEYLSPIKLLSGQHRALTHIALFTERRHIFVKAYPAEAPRGLLNDIVGYLVARHAGIHQPPGGVIELPAFVLARIGIVSQEPSVWCFASTSCIDLDNRRHGSLSALFGNNIEALRPILEKWPGFPTLVAFDAWLANVDRNTGNLILNGENSLLPIDHSDILTGPSWNAQHLIDAEECNTLNKLIDIIWPIPLLPLPVRSAILKSTERFESAYASARSDLYRWMDGGNQDTHRGHHFIWKRSSTSKENLASKLEMIL